VTEVVVTLCGSLGHHLLHYRTVVAVEGIALHENGVDVLRRKIQLKVRITEVVPAPDEPVTAMMGCFADMGASRGD
jgi:hypothetical protein